MTDEKLSPVQTRVAEYAIKKLVEHLKQVCNGTDTTDEGTCNFYGSVINGFRVIEIIEKWAAIEFKEEAKP